jgi:hypothetical protein
MNGSRYLFLLVIGVAIFLLLFTSLFSGLRFGMTAIHHVIETKAGNLTTYLGRFHPVAVHLPIAFTFGVLLTEVLFMFTQWRCLILTARVMLLLTVMGMLIAVPLGFAAVAEYGVDSLVTYHERVAVASFALMLATWGIREAIEWGFLGSRWRYCYRGLLLLAALVVAWAGFLGGELVHGVGHLAWPK